MKEAITKSRLLPRYPLSRSPVSVQSGECRPRDPSRLCRPAGEAVGGDAAPTTHPNDDHHRRICGFFLPSFALHRFQISRGLGPTVFRGQKSLPLSLRHLPRAICLDRCFNGRCANHLVLQAPVQTSMLSRCGKAGKS